MSPSPATAAGMRSSRSAPVVVTVVQSPTAPKPFLQTAAGIASVGAGIGAVLLIAQLSRSRMRDLGPGKWVRDRSLGGRMVRVSSDDEPGSYAGSGNARWRKSRPLQDLSVSALDEPGADPRAQLETAGRRRAAGAAAAAPQAQAPLAVWWDEPPVAIPTEARTRRPFRLSTPGARPHLLGRDCFDARDPATCSSRFVFLCRCDNAETTSNSSRGRRCSGRRNSR